MNASPLVETFLAAPLPAGGPGWLAAARGENRAAFAAGGLPLAHVEAWKYTALRTLAQRKFSADADAATRELAPAAFALPHVDGPRLVFVNGVFRADLSELATLPEGLTLEPLSAALERDPEPLRFALSRPALIGEVRTPDDAFVELNAAQFTDGVVLRVAARARIEQPVHLVFAGVAGQADLAWHLRNLVEVGEDAELELVEHHVGEGSRAQLGNLVTDIELREGARLKHLALQQAAAGANLLRRTGLRLHAKAEAALHLIELGAALARHELRIELVGDRSAVTTRGVFMPHGRQHIDTQLHIRHQALNTSSDSQWRGVADDRGRGVLRGAILVAPGADGTDANLGNKNLLLSPAAEIDTKPELEIYADEVKAAHGATVGQLDERSLFYLQSRGIPLAEAEALLTAAFCRAMIDDLKDVDLREHLGELLIGQLPA